MKNIVLKIIILVILGFSLLLLDGYTKEIEIKDEIIEALNQEKKNNDIRMSFYKNKDLKNDEITIHWKDKKNIKIDKVFHYRESDGKISKIEIEDSREIKIDDSKGYKLKLGLNYSEFNEMRYKGFYLVKYYIGEKSNLEIIKKGAISELY